MFDKPTSTNNKKTKNTWKGKKKSIKLQKKKTERKTTRIKKEVLNINKINTFRKQKKKGERVSKNAKL